MRPFFACLAALILSLSVPLPAHACGGAEDDLCQVPLGGYRIAVPVGVDAPGALVWLHGWGGSANAVLRNGGWVRRLEARGMALIAPDGSVTHPQWNQNRNWTVRDGEDYARDDIAFLEQVIADAARRFGIDRGRVLLAGFSRGGSMVWDAACLSPGLARAYAPVAGAFWDPMTERCAGPVDLFHTHGWTDRTVPLEGRPLRGGWKVQGDVFQSLFALRATNGCTNRQPEAAPISDDRWWRNWSDCAGARIDLMLHPGGHGVPRGWLDTALDWFEARLGETCIADAGPRNC